MTNGSCGGCRRLCACGPNYLSKRLTVSINFATVDEYKSWNKGSRMNGFQNVVGKLIALAQWSKRRIFVAGVEIKVERKSSKRGERGAEMM